MSSNVISDYMKIRRYVINLIYRSGNQTIQLPTVQNLCEQFQVSRPTVCKAMRELTDQGYVVAKRGIGSYTNPAKCVDQFNPYPVVGLLMGDGMGIYLSCYLGSILGEMIKQLCSIPTRLQQITLGSLVSETIQLEILAEKLDILVWVGGSQERIQMMRDTGLPVVAVLPETAGTPCSVSFGYRDWGYDCAKQLIAEGRRSIVLLHDQLSNAALYQGIRQAYHEAGIAINPDYCFTDSFESLPEIKKIIEGGGHIDAICNPMLGENQLTDMLLETDPEAPAKYAIVQSVISKHHPANFHEICYDFPYQKLARETCKLVCRLLKDKSDCKISKCIQLSTVIH